MKKESEKIEQYCAGIREEIARWKQINENGCNDPFWSDGTNMNLVRNHIIYYKGKILELCTIRRIPFPEEYYLATPPLANNDYMANYKQRERVARLVGRESSPHIYRKHYIYDEQQMNFF